MNWIKRLLRGKDSRIMRIARRGPTQTGVLSPLLWKLEMNELLKILERDGFRYVDYANDIVLIVSGKLIDLLTVY